MPENDPVTLIRSEACVLVTRTYSRRRSGEEHRHYEGMLSSDVRVGVPLVLYLNNGRRLTTSTITRIQPVAIDAMNVETANSRYRVRRLISGSELEAD